MNNPTVDYITYTDQLNDGSILGNNIIYTTGGVLEDIAPPATGITALFNNRLWLVDAEDPNLLWFSKQIIESTPVEMSDLLTMYIAPTTGSESNTGAITALYPMDDKLIIFKENTIYYINGVGPDNTGLNSGYSDAQLVTSAVGCTNTDSIVLQPNGLMFQSNKGIWLLSRDLNANYIGAPVESLTIGNTVTSATTVPGTNQIRFGLNTRIVLMYDYYFDQWGSFSNVNSVSSTLYQGLHTYITPSGLIYQETPGLYTDGGSPVLMKFSTSWINPGGLQGYQRAYFFYLIGDYITPHELYMSIAYDYNNSPEQAVLIEPTNTPGFWGGPDVGNQWGNNPTSWGGTDGLEQWRVFLQRMRCQAFQISLQEVYDPSFGIAPGAGFTLSGLNLVIGLKKGYKPIKVANDIG
jgi:hypothetical protein